MIKHFNFSRRLHWATLCCFFLPFFLQVSCGPSAEEKKATEETRQKDSIANQLVIADTVNQKNTLQRDTADTFVPRESSSSFVKTTDPSKSPSQDLAQKCEFLQPLLIPREDTFTGIATIIDALIFVPLFGTFISFLLLLIGLIAKFIDVKARRVMALLNLVALITLFISIPSPYYFSSNKLWGFWFTLVFVFALVIYDFYIIKLNNKETKE
jgi:hypothetical protein